MVDFKVKLREQLLFLQASAESYDRGNAHEALRIATTIRVMMHDKGRSVSLLTHLNAWKIFLPTSMHVVTDPNTVAYGSGLSNVRLELFPNTDGTQGYQALVLPVGPDHLAGELPAADWWDQTVYLFLGGERYRRRDIVLTAANNDGGAHVDATLPPIYHYLSRELLSTKYSEGDADENGAREGNFRVSYQMSLHKPDADGAWQQLNDIQYSDLRQMAEELLSSPDLMELAGV